MASVPMLCGLSAIDHGLSAYAHNPRSWPTSLCEWIFLFARSRTVASHFSLHASQLAAELVRDDLSVAPGHCFAPSADDRVGSRRA